MHWTLLGGRRICVWGTPRSTETVGFILLFTAQHHTAADEKEVLGNLGTIQQNAGWFFMLQCQAVLGVGHKAGGKLKTFQDLTIEVNWGGTRRWWNFWFNDLEIIKQMTRYFCDRNYNTVRSHEYSHKGAGGFPSWPSSECKILCDVSPVYLGEGKSDMTRYFVGRKPAVQFWIGKLHYLRYLEKSSYQVMTCPLLQWDAEVAVFVADLPIRRVSSKQANGGAWKARA